MTFLYIIIAISLALAAGMIARWYKVSRFRRNLAVGQHCVFYDDCDRFHGEIMMVDNEMVVIVNAYGTYTRPIDEILPA